MKENKYSIGLTFFRVIICLLIIKNMCFYLPMSSDLFGIDAIFPYQSYIELMRQYHLDFLSYPFNINYAPQIFLYLIIVLATLYMFGVFGRIIGVFLFISLIILKFRNGFILDGSDNVIQVILPWLILADNLRYFRLLDSNENQSFLDKPMQKISKIATIGFLVQIACVYFFTAFAKLQGSLWLNGTAVYYTMRVQDFKATDWNIPLTRNFYFVVISTYFTMFWELSFPFLVWFKQTRLWIIFFGILLHIGIFIFMRIDNFSWIMIASYFVFFTNEEYHQLQRFFTHRNLIIFVDGWCSKCNRFGNLLKRIDVFNNLSIINIRLVEPESFQYLNHSLAIEKMASTSNQTIFKYGFDSIYSIFLHLPLLWPFIPFLFILK